MRRSLELPAKRRCWLVLGAEGGEVMVPEAAAADEERWKLTKGGPGAGPGRLCGRGAAEA